MIGVGEAGGGTRVPSASVRILLYSHDSFGLGHLRRNLTLATGLVDRLPGADVLIATGSPCATQFSLPNGVEVVKLPSVGKDDDGHYVPRRLRSELDRVLDIRASLLAALCRSFDPQLLVVDHKVLGLRGELLDLLFASRRRGMKTILGLRDIIDAPDRVAEEWSSPAVDWALEEGYDRLCVYGVREVFDLPREYGLSPNATARTQFTGYVVRSDGAHGCGTGVGHNAVRGAPMPGSAPRPHVLVSVGGGEDGGDRIHRYLDALALEPAWWDTTLLTGPLMPSGQVRRVKRRAARLRGVSVRRFHSDVPSLLRRSSAVVAMCGYNLAAEILQSGCPAIFLPRTFPRTEQLIRASRFSELALARCLVDPDAVELRATLELTLAKPPRPHLVPRLDGCVELCDIAAEMLGMAAPQVAADRVGVGS